MTLRTVSCMLAACLAVRAAAQTEKSKPAEKAPVEKTPVEKAPVEKVKPAKPADVPSEANPKAGHSLHGEAFNEGPRRQAYLMPGMPNTKFDITTKSPEAQKFFNQGVGQLHGFWYLEAERSFRHVAMLDPNCAMAYWGMAMANTSNAKRAKPFIEKAEKLKAGISRRETMWIDAYAAFIKGTDNAAKTRALVRALEDIIDEFPNDPEPKSFLALAIFVNRGSVPIVSHQTVDSLIGDVLRIDPMHAGAHHYRIHLWDGVKTKRGLDSADKYGASSAGIAHAWHMPGHIFSGLQRYGEAAWQQEASARVDHAHMMRDAVMPYQIHNFAHNNQWMITSMSHAGRAHDAVAAAANLIEIPRHPKQNRFEDAGGASRMGRARLLEVLSRFELWDDAIRLCDTVIDPTAVPDEQVRRLRLLGAAYVGKGEFAKAEGILAELEKRRAGSSATTPATDLSKLPPAAKKTVDFKTDIYPILAGKCFDCHGGSTGDTSVRLDLRSEILGRTSGKSLVKIGDAGGSRLLHLVAGLVADKPMPPKGDRLTTEQVGLLRAWVEQGLKWDDTVLPPEKRPAIKKAETPKGEVAKTETPKTPVAKTETPKTNPYRTKGSSGSTPVAKGGPAEVERAVNEVAGRLAAAKGDHKKALEHFLKVSDLRKDVLARAHLAAGNAALAESTAQQASASAVNQVPPLATYVEILLAVGKKGEALTAFNRLKPLLGDLDADLPITKRLGASAKELGLGDNWLPRTSHKPTALKPALDPLGPLLWKPSPAPGWNLSDQDGRALASADYAGKPVVVVFYLGFGCLHCVEQLKAFVAMHEQYAKAGIGMVAISSESMEQLRRACGTLEKKFPFPIGADPELGVFKAFHCHDGFENQPLHGTFLIDGKGKVRWQDIGPDPYMDAKFLLDEAQRLLKLGEG